ncbi:hypothetical protein C8J57DRAFT_235879 [Mycena rebaudengoi]|nr:hypothetical protein C8J57DRAFT_235879 [Mycena rebaudengoi]
MPRSASIHHSHALILLPSSPLDPDLSSNDAIQPDKQGWALVLNSLLNPSPGRALDEVYSGLGRIAEKHANRSAHKMGLGPHAVAQRIRHYFGEGEQRLLQLDLLRRSKSMAPKLEKDCKKLVKYALPTESASTQDTAFKEIVDLVTLFSGLRSFLSPVRITTESNFNRGYFCALGSSYWSPGRWQMDVLENLGRNMLIGYSVFSDSGRESRSRARQLQDREEQCDRTAHI